MGQRVPGISRFAILIGVFVAAALVYVAVLVATDPQDNVTLVDVGLKVGDSGHRFATGTFRNNTDKPYARVEVDIDFLRKDGTVVSKTAANTINLGPGLTWTFQVPIIGENAVRFRLTKLACAVEPGDRRAEGTRPLCALGRPIEVAEPPG